MGGCKCFEVVGLDITTTLSKPRVAFMVSAQAVHLLQQTFWQSRYALFPLVRDFTYINPFIISFFPAIFAIALLLRFVSFFTVHELKYIAQVDLTLYTLPGKHNNTLHLFNE